MKITITPYAFNTEPITLVYIHETKMCFNGQDFVDNDPYWIKRLMHEVPISDPKIHGIIQNLENMGYSINVAFTNIYNKQAMTKRTKSGKKQKPNMAKNNGEVDTSMGRYYLEQGKVKRLNNKGEIL